MKDIEIYSNENVVYCRGLINLNNKYVKFKDVIITRFFEIKINHNYSSLELKSIIRDIQERIKLSLI